MTQSEQGDEPQHPAGRPAHEGVVLPPAQPAHQQWYAAQRQEQASGQVPGPMPGQVVPPQGQSWDQPWGPETQQPPAQQQMDPAQQHQAPQQHEAPQQHQAAQPYQAPQQHPTAQPYHEPQSYSQASQQYQAASPQQYPLAPPQQASQQAPQQTPQPMPQPMPQQQQTSPPPQEPRPQQQPSQHQVPQAPQHAWGGPPAPAGDADATQLMPPVVQGPGALPPENPAAQQMPAQQMPAQQTPAQQPGAHAAGPAEGTHFLGQQALQPPAGSDADATQYLPPVPPGAPYAQRPEVPLQPGEPGERQPPAEFDSLFRTPAPQPADDPSAPASTQQMPRFLPPRQQEAEQEEARYQQFQQPGPGQGDPRGGEKRRRISPVPLIAAVVVGCSVIGLGISALMSFAGDEEGRPGDTKNAASDTDLPAQQPAGQNDDQTKAQAEGLDKLLADSNNSRSAVINAVASIGSCDKLDESATALRDAATQRRDLVTRLADLKVDKLADHASLTKHLNAAWKASAAADDHYADWADKVASDKGKFCPKGKAKATNERHLGDRESGTASQSKKRAVGPWNAIAEKYELTKHQATDL